MLVDGARVDDADTAKFDRVCLLFNGYDEDHLNDARADWKKVADQGLTATYWAQADGKWQQKAKSGG